MTDQQDSAYAKYSKVIKLAKGDVAEKLQPLMAILRARMAEAEAEFEIAAAPFMAEYDQVVAAAETDLAEATRAKRAWELAYQR